MITKSVVPQIWSPDLFTKSGYRICSTYLITNSVDHQIWSLNLVTKSANHQICSPKIVDHQISWSLISLSPNLIAKTGRHICWSPDLWITKSVVHQIWFPYLIAKSVHQITSPVLFAISGHQMWLPNLIVKFGHQIR